MLSMGLDVFLASLSAIRLTGVTVGEVWVVFPQRGGT